MSSNINNNNKVKGHLFHIVTVSPWPLLVSLGAFGLTIGAVLYFHQFEIAANVFFLGFFTIILTSILWWRDVIREGSFLGDHTSKVQSHLKISMILFIISEVMFFSSFFWAFFHSSLAPAIEIGSVWPPKGIQVLNTWSIPLENTIILLSSGVTLTWAHHSILMSRYKDAIIGFILTLCFAIFFTQLQVCEYIDSTYTISDSVYGSIFFLATGFHGFHVIIGTIFIFISFLRLLRLQYNSEHHIGFEASAWYWHFVDVVWLFLFISIYWWGNLSYFVIKEDRLFLI